MSTSDEDGEVREKRKRDDEGEDEVCRGKERVKLRKMEEWERESERGEGRRGMVRIQDEKGERIYDRGV